jgi:two-component system NtrC family response regulator
VNSEISHLPFWGFPYPPFIFCGTSIALINANFDLDLALKKGGVEYRQKNPAARGTRRIIEKQPITHRFLAIARRKNMRRVPRIPVEMDAVLISEGANLQGTITNIGLQGAFITLSSQTNVDFLFNLRFCLPSTRTPLEFLVRTIRRTADGAGLEFLDLDHQELRQLWLALIPLWPRVLTNCPYCGEIFKSPHRHNCHVCQLPLDFQQIGYLERLPEATQTPNEMIGICQAMFRVFHLIRRAAGTDVPILVTGASGTGKEMVAQALHQRSNRRQGPFVAVNCGAIPRELLESELFGHERGAFTGAHRTVMGKVELANHGTLFLDEIGELPLDLQVKLLRFLQDFSFERVGGRQKIQVDLRVVSATNKDLKVFIGEKLFRDDLYYRLNGINIELPDLKDRNEDVLIMANVFLRRFANQMGKQASGFTREVSKIIQDYHWPGNVRELANLIRRAVVMAENPWIIPENLGLVPDVICKIPDNSNSLGLKEAKAQLEVELVTRALTNFQGNVQKTAGALKTSRSVIYQLINKYQLKEYAIVE